MSEARQRILSPSRIEHDIVYRREDEFCGWERSATGECKNNELNRSAFVAWIDCQL